MNTVHVANTPRGNEGVFVDGWDTPDCAMLLCNARGDIVDANPAFCALYGCDRGQIIGTPLLEIYPEPLRQAQAARQQAFLHAGDVTQRVTVEVRLRDRDFIATSQWLPPRAEPGAPWLLTRFEEATPVTRHIAFLERQNDYAHAIATCSRIVLDNPTGVEAQLRLLQDALTVVRLAIHASRVYYFRTFDDPVLGLCVKTISLVCENDIPCAISERQQRGTPLSIFPPGLRQGFEGCAPLGFHVDELFADTPDLRDFYLGQVPPLISVLLVPLFVDAAQWGSIGVDQVRHRRTWDPDEIAFLQTVSEIIGSALQRWSVYDGLEAAVSARTQDLQQVNQQLSAEIEQRRRSEQELLHRLQVEDVLSEVARKLLHQDMQPTLWREVLQSLASIVTAQRIMLVPAVDQLDAPEFSVVEWGAPPPTSVPRAPVRQWAADCPWLWQQVNAGHLVYLPNLADMPLEAAADRRVLTLHGIHALALLPMTAGHRRSFNVLAFFNFVEPQDLYADPRAETLRIMRFGANIIGNRLRLDAIRNTLEERVAERTQELTSVLDFAMLATRVESLPELLVPALDLIAEVGDCQAICIHLLTEDGQTLDLAVHQGLTESAVAALHRLTEPTKLLHARGDATVWVNSLQRPADLPEVFRLSGYQSYVGCQLRIRGVPIGLLSAYRASAQPFSVGTVSLMTALVEQLAIVIENHRLHLRARQVAIETERRRLTRELHDSITQSIYGLTLFARVGRYALEAGDDATLRDSLLRLETGSHHALKEMRVLLFQLQPMLLAELSLTEAIENRFNQVERKLGIHAEVNLPPELVLADSVRIELFRIIMEALNNSLKHAEATTVRVHASQSATRLLVKIRDNGRGFQVDQARKSGSGLQHMRERAESIHARLVVESAPGRGTTVTLALPKREVGALEVGLPSPGRAQAPTTTEERSDTP